MNSNKDQTTGPAGVAPKALPQPDQARPRQLSSSKSASYSQAQIKKQSLTSSDPVQTRKYLQNYLSDHTQQPQQKGSVPLKVLKQPNQAYVQSATGQGAVSGKELNMSQPGSQYASNTSHGHAGGAAQHGSNHTELRPNSRQNLNRNAASHGISLVGQQPQTRAQADLQIVGPHNLTQAKLSSHISGSASGEMTANGERRKDRAASSGKQKSSSQANDLNGSNGGPQHISRSLNRPNSRSRGIVQQANNSGSKLSQPTPSSQGGAKPPMTGQRGTSPKLPVASQSSQGIKQGAASQLNMTGQNLQSYFDDSRMAIPSLQANSSKNLPRKKRINLQPQQQQVTSNLTAKQINTMENKKSHALLTKNLNSSSVQKRSASPGQAAFSQSSSQQQQKRPSAAESKPSSFDREELFLNVDSQYNELLMQMIQPNRAQFDFDGSIQYVMNASELSNQALAKLLYSRPSVPISAQPESLPALIRPQPAPQQRSRNVGGDVTFNKNSAAGQSTVSFFNTKKSFSALTFNQAASGQLENATLKPEGYHDGPDSAAHIGKDFYELVRSELAASTPEQVRQLMADYHPAKFSAKRNGIVAAYGANTNQGIVRNYNEDRVAIILNIMKPKSKQFNGEKWPKCSFFGIYDGHGGHVCADFLRDYLHQFIIKDANFPKEPIQAIKNGFKEAEKLFLEFAEGQQYEVGDIDRSGSCAIVALIIDDMCYIGNTGDSRACLSADGGRRVVGLSTDHKPTDDIEMYRILSNNGRIYQNASIVNVQQPGQTLQSQVVLGPHRVFPGRLSVCRTFGDIEAKMARLDGNPLVVVADPDVTAFKIEKDKHDFIVIGCDGIFDKLENRDTVHLPWQACLMDDIGTEPLSNPADEDTSGKAQKALDERRHRLAGLAVDSILKVSALRRSCDNITAVVIAFDNFYRMLDEVRAKPSPTANQLLANDHDVFEEIQMSPVDESYTAIQKTNNTIYIENEDILESLNESHCYDVGVSAAAAVAQEADPRSNSEAKDRSQGSPDGPAGSSVLLGDTGTTALPGSAQASEQMTDLPSCQATAEKILSEIAEEDSVSMISDRPRRSKVARKEAMVDPLQNSLVGSLRNSTNAEANARLKDAQGKVQRTTQLPIQLNNTQVPILTHAHIDKTQVSAAREKPSQSTQDLKGIKKNDQKQPNPYVPDESTTKPLQSSQRPGSVVSTSGSFQGKSIVSRASNILSQKESEDSQTSVKDTHTTLDNRPSSKSGRTQSRPQSTKHQQRVPSNQSTRAIQKKNTQNLSHEVSTQGTANSKSRQVRTNNFAFDAHQNIISKTVPSIKDMQGSQMTSAYGNIGIMPVSQNKGQLTQFAAGQLQQTTSQASLLQQNSLQVVAGQSQSQSQQAMPQIDQAQYAQANSNLFSVKGKQRRSSNQSHQRQNYAQSSNSGQPNQQHKTSQNSMPPPSSNAQLVPLSNLSATGQTQPQQRSQTQVKNPQQEHPNKKSKTQQPNKLVELFRQVDGQPGQAQAQAQPTASALASNQFVNKGSISSNNQQMLMRVQMQQHSAAAASHLQHAISSTTQVHNIQIKPISSTKRRPGPGAGNLLQTANSAFQGQGQPGVANAAAATQSSVSISNILNARGSALSTADKTQQQQLSQTTILQSQSAQHIEGVGGQPPKQSGASMSTSGQSQLISQYLASVNQLQASATNSSSHQAQQASKSQAYGGSYVSRSTRNGQTANSEKSSGVLSRAQRVQRTYNNSQQNQNLPSSKSLQGHFSNNLSTSAIQTQQSRQQNLYHQGNSSSKQSIASAYIQTQLVKKGEKSRNTNSVNSSGSLPKWQSLSNSNMINLTSLSSQSMNQPAIPQQNTYDPKAGVYAGHSHVKKRKSNNP